MSSVAHSINVSNVIVHARTHKRNFFKTHTGTQRRDVMYDVCLHFHAAPNPELRSSINLSACQFGFPLDTLVFSSGVLFSCTSSDKGISSSLSLPSSVHTSSCGYRFGEGAHSQFSKRGPVSGLHLSEGGLILPPSLPLFLTISVCLCLSLSLDSFSLFKELYRMKQTERKTWDRGE